MHASLTRPKDVFAFDPFLSTIVELPYKPIQLFDLSRNMYGSHHGQGPVQSRRRARVSRVRSMIEWSGSREFSNA